MATSGHVGKVTRGQGEMNGRHAVAPLPDLIEGTRGQGDMGTRGIFLNDFVVIYFKIGFRHNPLPTCPLANLSPRELC
jgi:hypothetical protein